MFKQIDKCIERSYFVVALGLSVASSVRSTVFHDIGGGFVLCVLTAFTVYKWWKLSGVFDETGLHRHHDDY